MDHKKWIVFIICLGNIAISFNTAAVAAAIPDISMALHQRELAVAKIIPLYTIPYGMGALLYAPLTRIISYRRSLMVAMALYAMASLWSGCGQSLEQIMWAQVVAGMAAASSTPLSLIMIGDFFEKNIRGRLVGIYFGCSFFASIAGLIVLGLAQWRWLFLIPFVIASINFLSLGLLRIPQLARCHEGSIDYLKTLQQGSIQRVFLFIFAMSFLYHGVHKWYGIYLSQEYGLQKEAISFILVVVALCGLAGQQIGGHLSDKTGRLAACYAGLFGLSVGVLLLAGHYPLVFLTVVLGFISISWTMSHNAVSTILTDFPDEDRPIIASLNSAVRFISAGLGFSLSRYFVEQSFALTFFGIGILFMLMTPIVKIVFQKYSLKESNE